MLAKRGRELILDLMAAIGWMVYATFYLRHALDGGGFVDVEVALFITLLAVLFLMRHPPRKSGTAWQGLLGVVGTFLPAFTLRPSPHGLRWLGEPIQIIAVAGMVTAVLSLGRSFGIAPADRGLRTTGFYGHVRHPMYATELCFYIGYIVANPTWGNLTGFVASAVIQIVRIGQEERILEGYADYMRRVRYRLVPFIW